MAYDRPSWREIDKKRDQPGVKKRRDSETKDIQKHSTRYSRYKADLDRLFDQGLAGELLKRTSKEAQPEDENLDRKEKPKGTTTTRKKSGRITKGKAGSSRLKLVRTIVDTGDRDLLLKSIDELVNRFGMPDDWDVLGRVLEHEDEKQISLAITKMKQMLQGAKRIPRRPTLKERLRTIGQTARNEELRKLALDLEELL